MMMMNSGKTTAITTLEGARIQAGSGEGKLRNGNQLHTVAELYFMAKVDDC